MRNTYGALCLNTPDVLFEGVWPVKDERLAQRESWVHTTSSMLDITLQVDLYNNSVVKRFMRKQNEYNRCMTNTVNLALNSILQVQNLIMAKKIPKYPLSQHYPALTSIALTVMLGIVSYFGLFYQQKAVAQDYSIRGFDVTSSR
jgi:hypothetical protein